MLTYLPHRRLLFAFSCIAACICLLCSITIAQQTSRGRDFYFCYIPNYHNNAGPTSTDSLYVYVVADTVTTGTLTFSSRSGVQTTIPINITNPNTIWTYRVQYDSYELLGYNQSGFFSNANDNETARPNSFRVQTDKDVAVYALNKAVTTSDASLIFPATVLSNEYIVLAYKADGAVVGGQLDVSYTPSQFAIVATQDNTSITVTPSVPTTESGSAVKNFTLNRGQVYLFQSEFSFSSLNYDLTGSRIVANKPIAVFAGHQRTALPLEFKPPLRSRDQLYEQLLPPAFWGKSYVITPLAQPVGITTTGTDLWRVVAGEDNTVVRFNNTQIGVLNRGQFLERSLTSAGLLSCSKNVMVAFYKKTHSSDPSNTVPGDPFMMIIPPRRQYLTKYRYSNIQAQSNSFVQQFITVVTTRNNINSIQYDGNQLNANFLDIPNTCFAYANVSVTAGAHSIESQQPIGLYVYGYGDADSYGYVGGMALVPDVAEVDIDAGPDRTICFGDTVQLRVSGAARNIRWTPRTGLSCDTCVTVIAQPSVTTTYIVSATDSLGCDGRDTVVVNVRRFIVDAGRDTAVCPGYDSVTIRGRGVNGVAMNVRWTPPDWLACDTCLITKAKPPRTTRYVLTAMDSLGCIGRDTVNIIIRPPLEIDAGPDVEVCSFTDSIPLQVVAVNSRLRSVKWTPNPLGGIRCDTCSVTKAKAPGPITYYVTAIDTAGCTAIDSMKVKIGAATGRMKVTPSQSICFMNDSVTIGVLSRTLSVKWTPSIGLSCDTCRLTVAKPPYTTLPFTQIYVVTGLDSAGCAFRDSIRVTVLPKATVDIFPDETPCTSTGTTLIASGAFESVNWSPPTGISCTTCPNTIAIPPKRDIVYYARARNGNSADCEAVDSIKVKYAPGIEGQLPAQVTLCIGDSVKLALTFGGKVKWTPNTNLTCDTCKTQVIKPTKNVRYVIEADSAGCTSRAIVDIKLSTAAKVVCPPDIDICRGQSVVINATIDNVDAVIQWTPTEGLDCPTCIKPKASPTKTTTYIVSSGGAGCARYDTIVIKVNTPPNVRLLPSDTSLCEGGNVQFRMENHVSTNKYQWSPTTDLTCSDCPNPVASPKQTTDYTVKVTGANGCDTTLNARIGVGTRPKFTVQPKSRSVCEGTVLVLRATGEVTKVLWEPDDGTIDCPTCPQVNVVPRKTTRYTVRSIDTTSNCTSFDSVLITVNPLPKFDTLGPTRTFCKGVPVRLIAGTGNRYQWTPAPNTQLSATDVSNPTVTFPDTGSYRFGIRIYNADSCYKDSILTMRIIPCGDDVSLNSLALSRIIACDSARTAITLRASGQVDIRVDSITVLRTVNAKPDRIFLQQQSSLLLPVILKTDDPSIQFPVRIIPDSAGSYSITYRVHTSNTSRIDSIVLSGESYNQDVQFRTVAQTQLTVDSTFGYPVEGKSLGWKEIKLTAIDADIKYNNKVIIYREDRDIQRGDMLDSTWTITFNKGLSTPDHAFFTLRGTTPISKDGTLFTPYFRTLLGDQYTLTPEFNFTLPKLRIECAKRIQESGEVNILLCAANIRRISISGELFALVRITPNPVSAGKLSIEYTIGYPCQADIRLYDVNGKEVTTLAHGQHGEGAYLLEADASALPSGMYYCTMSAAGNVFTSKVLISK